MKAVSHIMGCTCAGKSTFLNHMKQLFPDKVHLVEVGKMMRAKYLDPNSPHYSPDHFKGQAAPEHTQEEAFDMYLQSLKEGLQNPNVRLILVDGQPRDVPQVKRIFSMLERNPYAGNTFTFSRPALKMNGMNEDSYRFAFSCHFHLIHAPLQIRYHRLRERFGIENEATLTVGVDISEQDFNNYRLCKTRLNNDFESSYTVMAELARRNVCPCLIDTSTEYDVLDFLKSCHLDDLEMEER